MKKISTADLKDREVINLCGGEKLGYPCEFEINLDDGKITAIIIENSATSLFGKKQEYLIPWCKIECIGEDAILVKIPQNELTGGGGSCSTGRKRLFCR